MAEDKNQQSVNNLRREILDHRANTINWWMGILALIFTIFGLIIPYAGYQGYSRFQELETSMESQVKKAKTYVEEANQYVMKIKKNLYLTDIITAEFIKKYPEIAKLVVERINENPDAPLIETMIADAVFLQERKKWEEAIEKWHTIAAIAEERDNDDRAARAWFSIGYLHYEYGKNPKDAVTANDIAIQLIPDYAEAYNNRGFAKRKLEQYDAAIIDYNEAIRLKPDFAEAYNNRGAAKRVLKQYEAAITDYNEAIRLKPDYANAYINRGATKHELKQYDAAISDYNRAIQLEPDSAVAYNNRCDTNNKLNRYNDAITDCDSAIRMKPELANSYKHRGISNLALGKIDDARQDFEDSLKLALETNNEKLADEVKELLTKHFSPKVP